MYVYIYINSAVGNVLPELSGKRRDCHTDPDPPTLALVEWKKQGNPPPKKNKGFSLHGTPKIFGKGRKSAQKKQGKQKKRKSKKARIRGSGDLTLN